MGYAPPVVLRFIKAQMEPIMAAQLLVPRGPTSHTIIHKPCHLGGRQSGEGLTCSHIVRMLFMPTGGQTGYIMHLVLGVHEAEMKSKVPTQPVPSWRSTCGHIGYTTPIV